jgi:hypothetical protein
LAVFFNRMATRAPTAHTAYGSAIRALHFSATAADGVATDPSDLNQSRDAAASPLECKQPHEAPPILFIQTCGDTIDRLVLFGHSAIGVLLAGLTNALMNIRFTGLFHARSSCCSSGNVYFASVLSHMREAVKGLIIMAVG